MPELLAGRLLRECLRLEALEFLLSDGSGVQERLGAADLLRRALWSARNLLDVLVLISLPLRERLRLPLGHAPASGDQVDQRTEPRQYDEQDRPAGLRPATQR